MSYTDSSPAIACVYNSRSCKSSLAILYSTDKASTYKKLPTMRYQVLTTALFTCAASASLATLAAKADTCADCPAEWKCVDSPTGGVTCIPLTKRDAVAGKRDLLTTRADSCADCPAEWVCAPRNDGTVDCIPLA